MTFCKFVLYYIVIANKSTKHDIYIENSLFNQYHTINLMIVRIFDNYHNKTKPSSLCLIVVINLFQSHLNQIHWVSMDKYPSGRYMHIIDSNVNLAKVYGRQRTKSFPNIGIQLCMIHKHYYWQVKGN